jgi:hypothetical protein
MNKMSSKPLPNTSKSKFYSDIGVSKFQVLECKITDDNHLSPLSIKKNLEEEKSPQLLEFFRQ